MHRCGVLRRSTSALVSTAPVAAVVLIAASSAAFAQGFAVHNLASDQSGAAAQTDADLAGGVWGISDTATSPLWLAAHGTGKSVLYDGAGTKQALVVTIPGDGSVTGMVSNGTAAAFNADVFLFVNDDATVSGWRGALGTTAEVLQTALPANVYKGIGLEVTGGHAYALVANFRTGAIDVLKGDGGAPSLAGTFLDPNLPSGFAPFNVQVLSGFVYVAYALQDGSKLDDVPGAGNGYITRFNLDGTLANRVVTQGALNSPWGMELSPAGFGDLPAGTLLVGNHGDGRILAYDGSGNLLETLHDPSNVPLSIPGIFALRFGNGGNGGSTSTLYFTASSGGHGLFGELLPASLPVTTVPALGPVGFLVLGTLLAIVGAIALRGGRAGRAAR